MSAQDQHVSPELLLGVFNGEIPLGVLIERELEHLHTLSPECARAWDEYLSQTKATDDLVDVAALERSRLRSDEMQRRLAADERVAEREIEELLDLDPAERAGRVRRAYRRFKTPALAERLIREAKTWLRHDPRESLALLELARGQVPKIDRALYGLLAERTAVRVLAHRANALRVLGDLPAADAGFAEVRARLASHPADDDGLYAEIASLEASLRYDQRRLDEARALLEQALELYQRAGNRAGLVNVTIQLGIVLRSSGETLRAIQHFEAAVSATDPDDDPELAISPRHSLVLSLCDLGRGAEARALLERLRPLYLRLEVPLARLWLHWAEGRVAGVEGDDPAALEHLRQARDGYLARDLDYEAALVSLDLAEVHLSRAETAEVQRLAHQVGEALVRRGVRREALHAVRVLRQAALTEAVSLQLLDRTRQALLRAAGPTASAA